MTSENRLSRNDPKKQLETTSEDNQNQAMQRYLCYLKSDYQPLSEEEARSHKTANNAWYQKPVSYPPFED